MDGIPLVTTRCAICDTEDYAEVLYPANFQAEDFSPATFSARRSPDRVHYRVVKCLRCGLVRSDPVAETTVIAGLYARSGFQYEAEVRNLTLTYGRYLAKLERFGGKTGALLEIGCGNGFFLEEASRRGYTLVRGVEPSEDAVAKASPSVRQGIVADVMRPGLFEEETFDVVCLFQVLDHLSDPGAVLEESRQILRPGGLVLCLNHDVDAFSARLLGARSPIIDIEHTYLFSRVTIARLLEKQGYRVLACGGARNTYSVRYLAHLLPLPNGVKDRVMRALDGWLGARRLTISLGNLYVVAERPN
jgi:SAM-dependent methyltransferase